MCPEQFHIHSVLALTTRRLVRQINEEQGCPLLLLQVFPLVSLHFLTHRKFAPNSYVEFAYLYFYKNRFQHNTPMVY